MLKKRIISSLWSAPLLLGAIWFGEPYFSIFLAVWGLTASFEFYRLLKAAAIYPLTVFGIIWTLLFILAPHAGFNLFPLLLTTSIVVPLVWLLILPQKERAFSRWAWTIAGIFYIGWLLSYWVTLRGLEFGRDWVILGFSATIATDTMAYFIGRYFGKHHLAPVVSPHKTWEGSLAGVGGAILASLLVVWLLKLPVGFAATVLAGILISVFGQLGDLVKSLFKRNMGVKDSGHIIPGHGGALDRLDSALFAGIVTYYFAIALSNGWLNWLNI